MAVLAVGVRRVDEGDTQVEGVVQRGDRLGLVGGAIGAGHPPAAQADRRDLDPAVAQFSSFHGRLPLDGIRFILSVEGIMDEA